MNGFVILCLLIESVIFLLDEVSNRHSGHREKAQKLKAQVTAEYQKFHRAPLNDPAPSSAPNDSESGSALSDPDDSGADQQPAVSTDATDAGEAGDGGHSAETQAQ